MEINITEWALDSYLELLSQKVFTRQDYLQVIRPNVMLLQNFPNDPKFQNGKFWSPAQDRNGEVISSGYKMKWHQVGNGLVQLRLTVAIWNSKIFLCEAYIKKDDKVDKRKLAKFKYYLELIKHGSCTIRGKLK